MIVQVMCSEVQSSQVVQSCRGSAEGQKQQCRDGAEQVVVQSRWWCRGDAEAVQRSC